MLLGDRCRAGQLASSIVRIYDCHVMSDCGARDALLPGAARATYSVHVILRRPRVCCLARDSRLDATHPRGEGLKIGRA